MNEIAYYDGNVGSCYELTVPFNDRSHFFGDGCYDATVAGNHVAFLLDEHLDRFYTSARALDINVPLGKAELAELINDLLQQVEGTFHLVYWQVTRGVEPRLHTYDENLPGKIWVIIREDEMLDPDVPVKLVSEQDRRFLYGNIKTLNLLPAVLYSQRAKRADVFETVLVRDGFVTECAHSNVHVLKDGVLFTHPNDEKILRGIGKTHLLQACYRCGVTVMEKPFTLEFLMNADEVIITTSSEFCIHACEVDGVPVGGKDNATLKAIEHEAIQEFLDATGLESLGF